MEEESRYIVDHTQTGNTFLRNMTGAIRDVQYKVDAVTENMAHHATEVHDKVDSVADHVRDVQNKVEKHGTKLDKVDRDIKDIKMRQEKMENLLLQIHDRLSAIASEK